MRKSPDVLVKVLDCKIVGSSNSSWAMTLIFGLIPLWHHEGVHQADDFFVCFGAKPNKGLSSRSSTRPEVDKGTRVRVGKGTQREGSWRRVTQEGQSTTVSRREQWGKTNQNESAFLVALWKFREGCMLALVCRCTGNAVLQNSPSSFVLFLPLPSVVFLVP